MQPKNQVITEEKNPQGEGHRRNISIDNFIDDLNHPDHAVRKNLRSSYSGITVLSFGTDEKEYELTAKRFSAYGIRPTQVKQADELLALPKNERMHYFLVIEEKNFVKVTMSIFSSFVQNIHKKLDKAGVWYTVLANPEKASRSQCRIFHNNGIIDHPMKPSPFDVFVLAALSSFRQAAKN